MKVRKEDISLLKKLQPELKIIGNQLSGCFYLSASLKKKEKKLDIYQWNSDQVESKNYIHDYFYITITLDDGLYPLKLNELDKKVLLWEKEIQEEYWHINPDDSLCLGSKEDILKMKSQYNFASFINILLTHYFYYMSYVRLNQREPWIGHRHGMFAALEIASISVDNLELIKFHLAYKITEWHELLRKTHKYKIENRDDCPFCLTKKMVKNCKLHKKQIKGYNNLLPYIKK